MRVYELMNILNNLPAGAEVSAHSLRTVTELKNGFPVDVNENNEDIYSVTGEIDDIDSGNMQVYLYF